MKIIIQCAGSKQPDAGTLHTHDGRPVVFIANPDKAPVSKRCLYARPDDISDDGKTSWRERLLEYVKSGKNPSHLLPAYQLYRNPAYENLVLQFGLKNVYILSAGWGLIPADFLTPTYDITFAYNKNKKHIIRRKKDICHDFNMLPDDGEDIVYLGGKNYQPMFCKLTENQNCKKIVYFNSKKMPVLPKDFELRRYETDCRTNWHYKCANDIADGRIKIKLLNPSPAFR